MSVKITYFVHGTTTDNEKDLATGWAPGELSELGIKQAKELGELVLDKKFFARILRGRLIPRNLALEESIKSYKIKD